MDKQSAQNNLALLLCRVSSEEQAKGYSLDFQERGGIKYAERMGLTITSTSTFAESASKDDRTKWMAWLEQVKRGPEKHILIPKVDRCLRNHDDLALVIKIPKLYGKTIHFFDDGIVFHKDSPASDFLRLGIQGAVAAWYSVDLSQKVKRGMNEKAEQGEWPERAPFGYKNNKATRRIDVDDERAFWVKRIKELSSNGLYSLEKIRKKLIAEGYPIGKHVLHKNLIERIIRNPIYAGRYEWPKRSGTLIPGKHAPIITWELHEAAVRGLERTNRPKYSKHDFALSGLMRCGLCPEKRAIVLEKQKGLYVYAHCTGVRRKGLCPGSEYVRQEILETQFIEALRAVQLNTELVELIMAELAMESGEEAAAKLTQATLIKQEIGRLEGRIRGAYTDKLDGNIGEADWARLNKEWNLEKVHQEEVLRRLDAGGPASYLANARKTLELSKSLEQLYFSANPADKRELLDTVCSNFFLNGKKLAFIYRKPFDLWAEGLSTGTWWAVQDLNL